MNCRIDRSNTKAISEANKYFTIEGCIALFVSFILNVFVVCVFANGLYGTTCQDAYDACNATGSIYTEEFSSVNCGP